jgi:hypothetical protein
LILRSWIYHFLFLIVAAAAAGILVTVVRGSPIGRPGLTPLVAIYGSFWMGELYNVVLLYLSKGASTSMGWYLYAVAGAEAVLLLAGLEAIAPARVHRAASLFLMICLISLDFYSVHFVSIPYYVGLTAHRRNGSVSSFHLSQLPAIGFSGVLARLAANKPAWLGVHTLALLWMLYCAANFLLLGLGTSLCLPTNRFNYERNRSVF